MGIINNFITKLTLICGLTTLPDVSYASEAIRFDVMFLSFRVFSLELTI